MGFIDKTPRVAAARTSPGQPDGRGAAAGCHLGRRTHREPTCCGEQRRFRDLLDRLGRETADPTRSHPTS
jgi:hypothetical protein